MEKKYREVIGWDRYFMDIAKLVATKSKDPNTQVGCIIVNEKNIVVGMGYNDLPRGMPNNSIDWNRGGNWENNKYLYIIHAEQNAILNSSGNLTNCKIYVTMFPCCNCAKLLIQAGIKEVLYKEDKYPEKEEFLSAKKMFDLCNVKYNKLSE